MLEAAGSQERIRKDLLEHVASVLQEVVQTTSLPLKSGGEFQWHIASPVKMLRLFLERSDGYRSMFLESCAAAVARHERLSILL